MIDDDPNLTTSRWVTEGLARAFGVCLALRDEGGDIPEDVIMKRITEDADRDVAYHSGELDKDKARLDVVTNYSDEEWDKEYMRVIADIARVNKELSQAATRTLLRHAAVKSDLEKLRDETTEASVKRIAEFGLEQLELVKNETEPYTQRIPTLSEYKSNEAMKARRDVQYEVEALGRAETRRRDTIRTYSTIRTEVRRVLG